MSDEAMSNRSAGESGIAAVLLLFAMSAFSVLSVAAFTTSIGGAPAGRTFNIFRSIPEEALTRFVATMVVPNDWRNAGEPGSFQFQLPVIVPETGGDDQGSSAAWHPMTDVPALAVCCESRAGVCSARQVASGGARIEDWTPGADDARWLSFDLASEPDPAASDRGETVTATVSTDAVASAPATAVTCQLEFDGAVMAKGTADLRQVPREGKPGLTTAGTLRFAVKTK